MLDFTYVASTPLPTLEAASLPEEHIEDRTQGAEVPAEAPAEEEGAGMDGSMKDGQAGLPLELDVFATGADVIIGSDIVHEEWMAYGVLAAVKRYLRPDGVAIICNGRPAHRYYPCVWVVCMRRIC